MSRSFGASLIRLARAAERSRQAQLRAANQYAREAERSARAQERARVADTKEQRRLYVESRIAEVEAQNIALDEEVRILSSLLVDGLNDSPIISFSEMRVCSTLPVLDAGNLETPLLPPADFSPKPLSKLWSWISCVRTWHEARIGKLRAAHDTTLYLYKQSETARLAALAVKRKTHAESIVALQREVDERNAKVDEFEAKYKTGDSTALAEYAKLVLVSSALPESFPRSASAVFSSESKQLLLEYDLPAISDCVPTVKTYKYVKGSDEIVTAPTSETQRRALYASISAQVVLRCLYELFKSDQGGYIETILLNAHVNAVDRGTGKKIRPCLVTVRTTREVFLELDLRHVEAIACLRTLNAGFSKSPAELVPVRPILELKMADPRFITEEDVLSTLNQRPNLMDLSPGEFESLITNLFQSMGLETKLTQASRDGGVDCVAYDPRPIFGGKVIIQAKRYKNTVGVSAVRDLFGTMQNEGASKGILVTTSGYGKAAFDFAANKPMELLSGSNLLYLLKEHASIDARIVMPDDWHDAAPDTVE